MDATPSQLSYSESAFYGGKDGFTFAQFDNIHESSYNQSDLLSFTVRKSTLPPKEAAGEHQSTSGGTNPTGADNAEDPEKGKSKGDSIMGAAPPPPPPDGDKNKTQNHDFDPEYGTGENFATAHRHEPSREKTAEETINEFKPEERPIVKWLLAHGHRVEKNSEEGKYGAGKQFDAYVDGVPTEFKKIAHLATQNENEAGISKTISTVAIRSDKGSEVNVIIDVSEQKGATEAAARRGIRRAYAADSKAGGNIKSITVIGKDFDVTVQRGEP